MNLMVCCVTSAAGSAEAARSTRQNHMLRCTSSSLDLACDDFLSETVRQRFSRTVAQGWAVDRTSFGIGPLVSRRRWKRVPLSRHPRHGRGVECSERDEGKKQKWHGFGANVFRTARVVKIRSIQAAR